MKSGFITLIGRSNVGKSTLLNTIIGTKIAAVSHRPQTTRNVIHGVLNMPEGQAVFIDTPGVFKESKNPLAGKLEERVRESIQDIDLLIYVVDPSKSIGEEERYMQSIMRKAKTPKILVINKSDLTAKEKPYLEDYKNLDIEFDGVFELSAVKNRHVEPLRQKVMELLPEGEKIYEDGQITNISSEFWLAEVIREKIMLALRQEVPYSVHVEIEDIKEKPISASAFVKAKSDREALADEGKNMLVIKAIIYTDNPKYKKMIIGAGGRAIKEIGIAARKEIETALNKKIYLELEVEKDKHWEERV